MYHPVRIEQLSHPQILKLLRGHGVRVKHCASGKHTVKLSKEQHKKLSRAHMKGQGMVLTFDPFQMADHEHLRGEGIFGKKFDRGVKHVLGNKNAKKLYSGLEKYAKPAINDAIKFGAHELGTLGETYGIPHQYANKLAHVATDYIDHPTQYQEHPIENLQHSLMKGGKLKKKHIGRPRKAYGGALSVAGRGVVSKVVKAVRKPLRLI